MNRKRKEPGEMTRKDFERIQERHWRRIEPYFERLQVEWILKDLDRQREALKDSRSVGEDG